MTMPNASPPSPAGRRPLPLADFRVIAIEQFASGPYGSMQLADLGADVVKVEDPGTGGDIGRYVAPFCADEDSLFFETFNRNKRSISLDLQNTAARTVLHDLVRVSDAVYYNLRGDVPERLGLTYAHLGKVNPRIVCCSLSGFGLSGPQQAEPAYDYILQGSTGWMDLTGEPGGPPTKSGLSLVDMSAGLAAALSLLAGVHAARRDGRGMDCDVSLFDTAISMLSYPATWHLSQDFTPARRAHSGHPSLVPFQNFQTADGWIVIGCAKEKFWPRMAEVIEPALARDPRFDSFALRREHEAELIPLLSRRLVTRPSEFWLAGLRAKGVPCGPVNDIAAALTAPQVAARDMIIETEHPRFGTVRQTAGAVRVGTVAREHRRAPRRNEHRDQVLNEYLGYDESRIAELSAAGAFGKP
jgi:crotonobetainyl-CoA:carnitine CoA-transferase CaiB-like acyl-CoA transferase